MKRKIISISDVSLVSNTWIERSFALNFHKVKRKLVKDLDLQISSEFEGLNPYLSVLLELRI